MDKRAVDELIEARYAELPPTLQRAARHAIDHPRSIALHSMRAVAAEAGLQASAMHRLARELGFEGYEALRDVYRRWLAQDGASFTQRATALQRRGHADKTESLVHELVDAELRNLQQLADPAVLAALRAARDILTGAARVFVAGLRSLYPAAFYFNYACGMFRGNTTLLSGMGGIFVDDLRHAAKGDALVVFSSEPYARDTVAAVRFAQKQGLKIISITDSAVSPISSQASALIVVPNATPSLFPSVVPALEIAQALVALLVASGGQASLKEIRKSDAQLRDFAVYVQP
ncbi:MurR/RpiR family transcriptional regulator [Bordetella sp. 2513F-2]